MHYTEDGTFAANFHLDHQASPSSGTFCSSPQRGRIRRYFAIALLFYIKTLTSLTSKFFAWAQQYGEIFHLDIGPQHVVVLNTAEAADELLANRAKDYSSRAAPHVAQDIMSEGQRLIFLPYGREWKVSCSPVVLDVG